MDFIEKMARVDGEDMDFSEDDEVRNDSDMDFIDGKISFQDQELSDY